MQIVRTTLVLGLLINAFVAANVQADDKRFEPDYVFTFMACRISGSSLIEPSAKNDGFVDMLTHPHSTACERVGKKELDCLTVFEEKDSKPVRYSMRVKLDTSKLLIFESDGGGDYLVANVTTGRVVSTTRLIDEKSFAVKLCHGMYLTGDEVKALEKRKK